MKQLIDTELSIWLGKNHPAAITSLLNCEYNSLLDIWWTGVEAISSECEYSFIDEYAATLPDSHSKKARTWLAILSEIMELEEESWLSENQFSLYAATLCEWLHGFEAASGNYYNDFEADAVCKALRIDDFYLGFLLGQSDPAETIDEIMYSTDSFDLEEIRSFALKQATSNERSILRSKLSDYFGSDTDLFWALHTAIWPKYNEPSADLCNDLVNPSALEDMAEVDDEWQFVTNGWTDSADE